MIFLFLAAQNGARVTTNRDHIDPILAGYPSAIKLATAMVRPRTYKHKQRDGAVTTHIETETITELKRDCTENSRQPTHHSHLSLSFIKCR
jgi:hypothetical protein